MPIVKYTVFVIAALLGMNSATAVEPDAQNLAELLNPVARFTTSGCGLWVAATRKKQSDFHRRSPIARPGDRGLLSSLPTS
jgi:hypothetical protein